MKKLSNQKDYQYIITETSGKIGKIILNRPEVLNALKRPMVTEIVTAMEKFQEDDDVHVIMLAAKGRAFAAGADIKEMMDDDPVYLEKIDQFSWWDRMALIKKPIVAAVQGYAVGGGFELVLSCDIVFAAEGTKFGFPEVNLGVMPGAGGTVKLTKALGPQRALEWLWTGEYFDAETAYVYGLINRVLPEAVLHEETEAFAGKLAQQPQMSLRLIKDTVRKAVDLPVYEAMQYERKNFYLLFATEDQKEGMRAFAEKRKPSFKGR